MKYNKSNKVGAGYFISKVKGNFGKIKIDVLPNHSDMLLNDTKINTGDEIKFVDLAKLIIKPNVDEYDSFKWSAFNGSKLTSTIVGKFGVGIVVTPPFVTVAVEVLTTNHLPNITGTCSVGMDMTFLIKTGNAYAILSETINISCTTSPYLINPSISLPDGKYQAKVTIS